MGSHPLVPSLQDLGSFNGASQAVCSRQGPLEACQVLPKRKKSKISNHAVAADAHPEDPSLYLVIARAGSRVYAIPSRRRKWSHSSLDDKMELELT